MKTCQALQDWNELRPDGTLEIQVDLCNVFKESFALIEGGDEPGPSTIAAAGLMVGALGSFSNKLGGHLKLRDDIQEWSSICSEEQSLELFEKSMEALTANCCTQTVLEANAQLEAAMAFEIPASFYKLVMGAVNISMQELER